MNGAASHGRELEIFYWLEDHGFDAIGASDIIHDVMQYGRAHPDIPPDRVHDVWWNDIGRDLNYPDGGDPS